MNDEIKRVSWLELFYDLVFVALVAQLTYAVADYHHTILDWIHITVVGFLIYFAWMGTTVNRNLMDEEDTADRLLVQLQMVFAFSMSLSLTAVFESQLLVFCLSYTLIRLVQIAAVLRLYRLKPDDAPKTKNVLQGMAIAALLVAVAGLMPLPYAYVLLGMAIMLEVLNPLARGKGNKVRMLNMHHIQERLGLYLLLVMGESVLVVAIANTVADGTGGNPVVVMGGLIMMGAFWWTYFRHLESCASGQRAQNLLIYLYAHAFLFGSIVLVAAAFKNMLKHPSLYMTDLMLLVGGVFLFACMSYVIRGQLDARNRTGIMRFLVISAPLVGYGAYLTESVSSTVIIMTGMVVLWAIVDEWKRQKNYQT